MQLYVYKNLDDFNVRQTLECGQIFRFAIDGNRAQVNTADKLAVLITEHDKILIQSDDVEFFVHFFDLARDYGKIKKELLKDQMLAPAIKYGYGIRILNNNLFEMIVSFIISANNNIKRIQKSIETLCIKFGKMMNIDEVSYHAFPTLAELKCATIQDYKEAGLGYRAEYMYTTMQCLTEDDLKTLRFMSVDDQRNFLLSLKGVGEKVMNCIMLFGLGVKSSFPVDTWISKLYNNLINTTLTNRHQMTTELTKRYGMLSGYAQQYFFYYYRNNKMK